MAEAVLHDLVEAALAGGDVVVHDPGLEAVDLEHDRAVAVVLDQVGEELVAQVAQLLDAVGGLAETQQPGAGGQRAEEGRQGGAVEGTRYVLEVHAFNGIVELSV
ncbi:hypothetical protein GCM10020001_100150 [Nonomuraea salmonea]